MIDFDMLYRESLKQGIKLNLLQIELMDRFAEFLIERNKNVNLTAIVTPKDILYKHFLDSLLALNVVDFEDDSSFLDVGAGAGFPSIPILIVKEKLKIVQLDSLTKRVSFLKEVLELLKLDATVIKARAEELAQNLDYREKFDYVSARAVARLDRLLELCLPFVKVGGFFIAFKGLNFKNELEMADRATKILGGKVEKVKTFKLDGSDFRAIIVYKKISQTLTKYPRPAAKISKVSL